MNTTAQIMELGDVVYLSGVLYTAREGVYRKVVDEGHGVPESVRALTNVNFHCSPAATVRPDGSYAVEAVTATASFRFGKSMTRWFERSGAAARHRCSSNNQAPRRWRHHRRQNQPARICIRHDKRGVGVRSGPKPPRSVAIGRWIERWIGCGRCRVMTNDGYDAFYGKSPYEQDIEKFP